MGAPRQYTPVSLFHSTLPFRSVALQRASLGTLTWAQVLLEQAWAQVLLVMHLLWRVSPMSPAFSAAEVVAVLQGMPAVCPAAAGCGAVCPRVRAGRRARESCWTLPCHSVCMWQESALILQTWRATGPTQNQKQLQKH